MARRPNVPCKHPGCAALVPYGTSYCVRHAPLHRADRESAARRGYDAAWRRESKRYLLEHPLCVRCLSDGHAVPATVVDHVTPHRGDKKLFWDKDNWQALCKRCHDKKTMTEDRYQEYHF